MFSVGVYFVFTVFTCFSAYYIVMLESKPDTQSIIASIFILDVSLFYLLILTVGAGEKLKREGNKTAILTHIAISKHGKDNDLAFEVFKNLILNYFEFIDF